MGWYKVQCPQCWERDGHSETCPLKNLATISKNYEKGEVKRDKRKKVHTPWYPGGEVTDFS